MSADPVFTLTCDNKSGDLAEEVRMAAALATMFDSWKRDRSRKSVSRSPWGDYWGPWANGKSSEQPKR